ncbi:MAG TPA: GntR family transcriptional regulator [Actinopolymorphaceae bacterium]|nr:GntR family transcriptional regulator [Actinopolymorphaceae bacterium]
MLIRLDETDPAPLYRQIAAAVRRGLADGELTEGDRLPPARALAASLGVNLHTVLRGYAELERDGLVQMRRGRGVTVRGQAPDHARLRELVSGLVAEARQQGIRMDELVAMLEEER